jgi:hypothetical protein
MFRLHSLFEGPWKSLSPYLPSLFAFFCKEEESLILLLAFTYMVSQGPT